MNEKKRDVTRRRFLATTTSGLISAGMVSLAPGQLLAQVESEKPADKNDGVILHRKLGKTGMSMPIVSMGVGGTNNPALIQTAYETGVRMFDTAAYYAYGRNEQLLGKMIGKMGVRNEVFLATKIHTPGQRNGLTPPQSKAKFLDNVKGSLSRLGTDHIDILYVHDVRDPETVGEPGAMEALLELKKQGKIKAAGIATHSRMAEVIQAVIAHKDVFDVVLTSFNFTMYNDTALLQAIADAKTAGIGVVAMKTQAGGSRWPNPESRASYSAEVINKACLKWVLANENVTTCIPGYQTFDHLNQDFSVASNLPPDKDEARFLSDNSITLGMGFCRQCRGCLASCPSGVEVPDLMRTHMYIKQYANFELARQTLDDIPPNSGLSACSSCEICVAGCVNSVDIPAKIAELKLIYG